MHFGYNLLQIYLRVDIRGVISKHLKQWLVYVFSVGQLGNWSVCDLKPPQLEPTGRLKGW